MSHFVIGSLKSENWYTEADFDWLPAGGVIADCLKDLKPDGGILSVYEVEETASDDLVRRIVAAIAAGANNPRDVAYFRFPRAAVEALQVTINPDEPGRTGDDEVNALHRDLQQLSATKLAELAGAMAHGTLGRFTAKTLRERIKAEVEARRLALEKVSRKLRDELGLG